MHPLDYVYAVQLSETAKKAGFDLRADADAYTLKLPTESFLLKDSSHVYAFLQGWDAYKRLRSHIIDFEKKPDKSIRSVNDEVEEVLDGQT